MNRYSALTCARTWLGKINCSAAPAVPIGSTMKKNPGPISASDHAALGISIAGTRNSRIPMAEGTPTSSRRIRSCRAFASAR